MFQHESKLQHATVVAGFESQDDAEEALLGLRLSGIPDDRIGLYYPTGRDKMMDLLVRYHRFSATILGFILGAIVTVGLGLLVIHWGYPAIQDLDRFGVIVTSATCGGLFGATVGGMTGFWRVEHDEIDPEVAASREPFVLTVDAGEMREETWSIIRFHGGHEVQPPGTPPLTELHAPAHPV